MAASNPSLISFPAACDGFPDLIFHLAGAEDVEELTKFIMTEFFYRFPLKDAAGFDVDKEIRPWIGKYISHVCSKNFSIILRDTSQGNRISAACINDIDCKNRPDDDIGLVSFNDPMERPGWNKICQLLDELHVGMDLAEDPILSIDLQAVGENYANRGLSSHCTKLTIQLAKSRGMQSIKVEAVNEFMALTLAKVGFELAKEIDYNQFQINGEIPFATKSIHQKARLFIHKI